MRSQPAFHLAALLAGIVFGAGLAVSGMTDPAKVKAFLDIAAIPAGGWDPSLAFVLAAAVIVMMAAVRVGYRLRRPLVSSTFFDPRAERVDRELVTGSLIFGVGWGLAGLCPGPAIADVVFAFPRIVVFLAAMLAGATLVNLWRLRGRAAEPGDTTP